MIGLKLSLIVIIIVIIAIAIVLYNNDSASSTTNNTTVVNETTSTTISQVQAYNTVRTVRIPQDFFPTEPGILYLIDGMIDMGTTSIPVPSGGLKLASTGFGSFEVSGLKSSEDNYTMFVNPDSGHAGGVFLSGGLELTLEGTDSQFFDLDNDGNFDAVELNAINFNGGAVGTLANYRQFLGLNVGLFGNTNGLIFEGTWSGARLTTCIARGLASGGVLFQAGAGLNFSSRFLTDLNVDLPPGAILTDFAPSNFTFSGFQMVGSIVARNGVFDTADPLYFLNIDRNALESFFKDNVGIKNTWPGATLTFTNNVSTVVSVQSQSYKLAGTTAISDVTHFSSPVDNRLVYDSALEREFSVSGFIRLESASNRNIRLEIRLWDNSASAFTTIFTRIQRVLNNQGSFDVADFNFDNVIVDMDQNDYLEVWVANTTDTNNITIEPQSELRIRSR